MSTRSRPPTDTYDVGAEFDDERTIVDGGEITPVEPPRCVECGTIVFDDDFDDVALAMGLDRCVRSKPGAARPWHWCSNYSPEFRKLVQLVPR